MLRKPACVLTLLFVLAIGGLGSAAAQEATPVATPLPGERLFALPGEQVFPEGVAYDEANGVFYVGSSIDGAIFRGDVAGGQVEVFVPGVEGNSALGMKADGQGRLFVAGGTTGEVAVYDTASGALIAVFANGLAPNTFLNDVAIAPSGDVYVTDSFNPLLFRVASGAVGPGAAPPATGTPVPVGGLEVFLDLTGTAFAFGEGFNANGAVVTADGALLLLVQSNTGSLYRIDLAGGAVTPVDLGGATVAGDGMLLDGLSLYVVADGEIVVVELGPDFATGSVVDSFGSPSFSTPTTIARYDGCLLVVNSQFANQGGTPLLPFTVSAVPIPEWALAAGGATAGAASAC